LYGTGSSTTRAEGQVDQLFVTRATASFFTTLGAQPQQGRLPTDDDDDTVVVISDWLWRSWFGSDEKVIGRSYHFAGGMRSVIGTLLMRSFWQLSNVDAGYDTDGIFTFQIAAGRADLNDRAAMSRFQYAFMDRLQGLPGVESVGYITTLPLDEGAGSANITTPRFQASGAEAPLVRVAGAGARTSRQWASSSCAAATSSGSRKNGPCPS
jgi:hypothetical protein